jgi:carbon monoxide dehydrogenase subunit G
MALDFTHSIEIDRPAGAVFEYVANFENNPRWQGGMAACRWTSPETMEVGATYVQEAKFLGRRIDTHFVVSEFEAGRRISIESTQSTFPIQVTRSVEPLGQGRCRVTAHVRGQPTGILKLFSGMVKKSIRKDYGQLKAALESEDQWMRS